MRLFCIPSSNKIQALLNLCNNLEEKWWSTMLWMQKSLPPEKKRVIMCTMDFDIQRERKEREMHCGHHVYVCICVSFFSILIFRLFYCHFNVYARVVLDAYYCYYRDGCVTSNPKWNCPIGHQPMLRMCIWCAAVHKRAANVHNLLYNVLNACDCDCDWTYI